MRMLDQQPRATIAQKRIALAKLLKDFDRVRASLAATTAECATIVVNVTESGSTKGGGPVGNGSNSNKNPFDEPDDSGAQSSSVRQPKLIQTLQGKDVDEAIMREREKELQKINRDIRLVNEMFKDMADIVDKQGVMVDEIVVSTEKSHEKAKAGLDHVKKAASNQSSCLVS
jgi:syntaxin 7